MICSCKRWTSGLTSAMNTRSRLARVTGLSNGNRSIRIRFDGDSHEDGIDYPHAGGKKRSGDTVMMFPLGGGAGWVGFGPVFTEDRADSMQVDGDDIESNAIDTRHIRGKSVRADHIEDRQIKRVHLENNAVGKDQIENSLFQGLAQKSDISALRTDMGKMRGDLMKRIQDIKSKAGPSGGGG